MAGIAQPIRDLLTLLAGIEGIAFAQVWNNQLQFMEDGGSYSFPLPAAFVETDAPFDQIGLGVAAADLTFTIHLVADELNATNGEMDQNFSVFTLRDKVCKALTGARLTGCTVLQRGQESQDFNHTNLYHHTLMFRTHFFDSKGSPYDPDAGVYVDSTPPITLELNVNDKI